jgi:Ca2+-transporting ATPase
MALGIEPKEMNLMKRMPRNPNQGVLTKVTWLIILLQSMLIAILTMIVYIISLYYLHDTIESAQSLVIYYYIICV